MTARPDTKETVERILGGLKGKGEFLDPDYLQRAEAEVKYLAHSGRAFTSETVLDQVGYSPDLDPRTIGAVMKNAQRKGLIKQTGAFRASRLRHGAPLREWVGAR